MAARPIVPSGVRYVITLDADTRLPRGTAKRLIGKMAHPLNRPRLDPDSRRVVEGYAVLQPRVTPSLPSGREGSLFQRIFTSPSGLDPYAFAVSDVYQDLFGEGSYSGKGIYDVDAFEAALDGRLPESVILSHDLLEGIFARAGLATDIEVVEEFPSRYDVAAARQHRWARGDWQLLPWIFGRGTGLQRRSAPNRHSPDRPLEDDGQPAANAVGAGRIPRVAGGMDAALGRRRGLERVCRRDLRGSRPFCRLSSGWCREGSGSRSAGTGTRSATDFALSLSQVALLVTLLAHQAWLMTDAIVRTFFRLFVRHRRLLEWVTAAQARLSTQLGLGGYYRWMAGGIALRWRGHCRDRMHRAQSMAGRGSIRDPVDGRSRRRAMGESFARRGRFQSV